MPSAGSPNHRTQHGEQTRRQILKTAVDLASRQGLETLSIGDLAKALGMSKSGLFAHFGSKEELQIATIEAAEKVFAGVIIKPACEQAPPGLACLATLLERYIGYVEAAVFSGGCFFSAAAAEFDDRPGRVRDRIAESMRRWSELLAWQAREAQDRGELDRSVEPGQLAFELHALAAHANFSRRLMGDAAAFPSARRAIHRVLASVATAEGLRVLDTLPAAPAGEIACPTRDERPD